MYRKSLRPVRALILFQAVFLAGLTVIGQYAHAGQNAVEAESAKIWVGKKARGFTLAGIDGKPVDIGKNLGKRPVVLVFYRGVW